MDNASRLLGVGGRLAFFMPCAADADDARCAGADETPSHPMLRLVAKSDQMLSTRWGRRLVTFEKIVPYDEKVAKKGTCCISQIPPTVLTGVQSNYSYTLRKALTLSGKTQKARP